MVCVSIYQDDGELSESTSDGEWEETRSIAAAAGRGRSAAYRSAARYDADGRRTGAAAARAQPAFRVLQVSCLVCTVTFYANLAHSLTRSP